MKINVTADELFPHYFIKEFWVEDCGDNIEVDEETYKRWAKAYKEFYLVRKEIGQVIGDGKQD